MVSRDSTDHVAMVRGSPALPNVRNTALLSAALASHSAMLSLTAAVAWITLVGVLEVEGLLGLGPAIVLAAGALAALPAGRGMDRFGRVPVLVAGLGVGAAGCGLAALGSAHGWALAVLAGLAGVGVANGASLLARTAALLGHQPAEVTARAAPVRELVGRPGVVPALLAAQASVGVMVAVMTFTGAVVVDHFGHEHHDVFPVIGAHFIGMYALVIVIGELSTSTTCCPARPAPG
jgi:MFS family permease